MNFCKKKLLKLELLKLFKFITNFNSSKKTELKNNVGQYWRISLLSDFKISVDNYLVIFSPNKLVDLNNISRK